MGVGGFDGFVLLAKQVRKAQEDMDRRREEHRARAREHILQSLAGGGQANLPTEDICCPRCRRCYPYGDECPHCGEALVGATQVEASAAPVHVSWRLRNHPVLAIGIAIAITLLPIVVIAWVYSPR